MMRVRKLTLTGVATLCALAGALLLSSAPAMAARIPAKPATLPAPTGGFSAPTGLGVGLKGEIFVDNNGSTQVDKYGSNNLFTEEFPVAAAGLMYQMAVDDSSEAGDSSKGDIYVTNLSGSVLEYTPTGTKVRKIEGEGLIEPTAVAVNSKGDVYVADFVHAEEGKGYVNKYGPKGELIKKQFVPVGLNAPEALAVNSSGDLFVGTHNGVLEYEENGTCMNSCAPFGGVTTHTMGLAVDSKDNVYVGEEGAGTILVFDSTGKTLLETIATGIFYPFGIGVSGTTVYVTNFSANAVDVFVPEQPLSARTEPATEVTKTTAKLHARVALEGGGKVKYHFDYGTTTAYGTETPEEEVTVTSGAPEAQVTVGIPPLLAPPLQSSTPYHYKIVATDTKPEVAEGQDETLNTQGPPIVISESATAVKVSEATLQATINPNNQETTCRFEYGTEPLLKAGTTTTVPCEQASLGNGFGAQPASAHIEHLQGGTTYHYRVLAENAVKETSAPSEGTGELTTAAARDAVIEAESVSVETGKEAEPRAVTFTAQVNPELQAITSCAFEYGKLGGLYEASVPCEQSSAQIGDGSTGVSVEAKVVSLQAGVDYHYRFVVKNATGTTEGADQLFGPPTVVTGAVLSAVPGVASSTTATVGGELNAESLDAHYYVQYGAEGEGYAQSAPFLPLGVPLPQGIDAGSGVASVVLGGAGAPPDVSLEGLTPGALYRYRLVAYNADGTAYGAPMTVMVPPAPSVGPASVSEVAQSSVTISTSVNPQGLHTLYKLDLGTSSAYGTPYPGDAGSGSVSVPLTFNLTGLEPGTTYHFRLMASSSDGTSSEVDQTFTTASSPLGVLPVFSVPPSPSLVPFTALAFPGESRTVAKKKTVKKKTAKKGKKGKKGGKGRGHGRPGKKIKTKKK
jgi:hypothetical protein